MEERTDRRLAVIGGGSIGVAWSIVFARAGFLVTVSDPEPERRSAVADEVARRLDELAEFGLIDEAPATVAARIVVVAEPEAAVEEAVYVQECAPEDVEVKRALFARLDAVAPGDAVLASSSSMIGPSRIAEQLAGRHRVVVAHPGNPPYLLPVVELVRAPFTSAEAVQRASAVLEHAGMGVVHVRREVEGFVFNRLQGALLREAYCLVRDGVVSVDDLDRVVREGLGRRWGVVGPFETADLNTRGGVEAHAARMGPAYGRMGAERGQHDPWTPDLVARVTAERRALLPLADWEKRVAWRDRMLMVLERARRGS